MKIIPSTLEGVFTVETAARRDHRGEFARWFCEQELNACLGRRHIVQINRSITTSVGAVRGMHYQRMPHAEMKLVRCIAGRVWDVAVDLRQGSATRLRWYAQELSADNARMLVIPEGCAHGFQVLEAGSELLYLHTAAYEPTSEGGVLATDPALGIPWPLPIVDLSDKDRSHPPLDARSSA